MQARAAAAARRSPRAAPQPARWPAARAAAQDSQSGLQVWVWALRAGAGWPAHLRHVKAEVQVAVLGLGEEALPGKHGSRVVLPGSQELSGRNLGDLGAISWHRAGPLTEDASLV